MADGSSSEGETRRLLDWLASYQWYIAGALSVLALFLAVLGTFEVPDAISRDAGLVGPDGVDEPWDRILRAVTLLGLGQRRLPAFGSPYAEGARAILLGLTIFTLLKVWAVLFREQWETLRLRSISGHSVFCGLGEKGFLLAHALRARGERVVAVDNGGEGFVARCRAAGILPLQGDARDPAVLVRAGILRASRLVSVCGDDVTNGEIAAVARKLLADAPRGERPRWPLACLVHIADLDLYQRLRETELDSLRGDLDRLQFFNVFESGARALLADFPPAIATSAPAGDPRGLAIVGFGRLGQNLLLRIARDLHLTRGEVGAEHVPVFVVDPNVEDRLAALRLRCPRLESACDIRPVPVAIGSAEFEAARFLVDPSGRMAVRLVYVCVPGDALAVSASLAWRRAFEDSPVTIVVRVERPQGLALLVKASPGENASHLLEAFGLLSRACTTTLLEDVTIERLAIALHRHYVEVQIASDRKLLQPDKLTLRRWEDLTEELQESNRAEAAFIPVRLAKIGCRVRPRSDWSFPLCEFSNDEVETLACLEHERWKAERLRYGWQFGPGRKDPIRRTNPLLVPWADLGPDARKFNLDSARGLPELLRSADLEVQRGGEGRPAAHVKSTVGVAS